MANKRAIFVVDLAFGDCGKGSIVDWLARRRQADLVVRFNGGPQAGHNVVTPDGRHHTFSQFGSASLVTGVRTLLSRFMLIEPYAMFNEAEHLRVLGIANPFAQLMVDRRCPVITPAHQIANQLRELYREDGAHGTCGMGIGELMSEIDDIERLIVAGEFADRVTVRRKLLLTRDAKLAQMIPLMKQMRGQARATELHRKLEEPAWIDVAVDIYADLAERITLLDEPAAAALLRQSEASIFEGAQGVLLDENFGFHPHTTWSTTTFSNAQTLLDQAGFAGERFRLGVMRSYFTRHGSGPFVTEDALLRDNLPDPHNADAGWQGAFRVGVFDAVAARYALRAAGGVDGLAITHLDRLTSLPGRICAAYRRSGQQPIVDLPMMPALDDGMARMLQECQPVFREFPQGDEAAFIAAIETELHCRIAVASNGPTFDAKRICPGFDTL